MSELVRLEHVWKTYGKKPVLKDVSIRFPEGGGTLIVGQTGSGKTTMAQILCGGISPDSGSVVFEGKVLPPSFRARDFKTLAEIQYIFQDPYGAVDPRQTVRETLSEPVRICRRNRWEFVEPEDALRMVDAALVPFLDKRAGVLSGGQLQKICVARALIPKPKILIADEAAAMLDREGAKELYRLLHRIRREQKIALIAIVHDIDFSDTEWDRIAVFCDGEIVEQMDFCDFARTASHPYSRKLIESYEFFAAGR